MMSMDYRTALLAIQTQPVSQPKPLPHTAFIVCGRGSHYSPAAFAFVTEQVFLSFWESRVIAVYLVVQSQCIKVQLGFSVLAFKNVLNRGISSREYLSLGCISIALSSDHFLFKFF